VTVIEGLCSIVNNRAVEFIVSHLR